MKRIFDDKMFHTLGFTEMIMWLMGLLVHEKTIFSYQKLNEHNTFKHVLVSFEISSS